MRDTAPVLRIDGVLDAKALKMRTFIVPVVAVEEAASTIRPVGSELVACTNTR